MLLAAEPLGSDGRVAGPITELLGLQELANTAWAFARVNFGLPKLFDLIAGQAEATVDQFQPWDLVSCTSWQHSSTESAAFGTGKDLVGVC